MRAADNINMHFSAIGWDAVGKWCAIALADGSSDHVLYGLRREAVSHQHHNEEWYCYVKIIPLMMGICEAQTYIDFHRKAYDAGFRLTDPDAKEGGRTFIMRGRPQETVQAQLHTFDTSRWRKR